MKKYIIKKDYKRLKKGQEVELSDEFYEIFSKIGLFDEPVVVEFKPKSKGKK